ncbi:polyhomeotic-like protein 3 [Trichoplusia ni]|uniref:Polyhomeotic-like protein 3 n=1 Tax=Trichoplusia ni TaxID=7111 RepID=A0A7E5WES4_TRINI|nr:polyhomeotic-like protein 3 [Trichoplusia ni]
MYLKMYIKSERFYQQPDNQALKEDRCFSDYEEELDDREGGGGGGGGGRRCARDAASPAHAPPPTPTPAPAHAHVKSERLSPHDSNASRSRSVTPSTSSYPGTPPERGSPHAPAQPAPAHPPRNYSDIMRSLAARYNTHNNNDYYHRMNGFTEVRTAAPAQDATDAPLGGLFTKLASKQGGPPRLPAFPVMLDMSSTKTLLAISRVGRGGRSRRKRTGAGAPEHSPLDLSAAGESAAKRARLSASPSTRSDSDDRDRVSNDDRIDARGECLCAEARARLSAWSVDEVCDFINSIDICAEYATNFREQRIDGSGLPLLTEDHLTGMLQMKLGPALKLRAVLARRLEPCVQCQANSSNMATTPRINGAALKPEPRSNTTSPS